MMCFSRPKSRTRGDDLMDGLILQIMKMSERKSSARGKAAREGLADRSNNYVVRTPSMALQASSASPSVLKGEPIILTAHLF
jgi:hypothetical protein